MEKFRKKSRIRKVFVARKPMGSKKMGQRELKIGLQFKFKFARNDVEKELEKETVQKSEYGELDERSGQIVVHKVELE